jgi:glycosyltransferase involved in cell wall biosynthesis
MIAVASAADSPIKGVATLLRAFAKLATERDVQLVVVGKPGSGGPTERLVGELALGEKVRFAHGISDAELAGLAASAEVAVVPSLYEGFSLPAVEHMASGTPLIVSRTGALPEVVGDTAVQVQPGDPEELATALRDLLDSPRRRAQLGEAAWRRVQERFAWPAVARATVAEYERAIAARRDGPVPAARPGGPRAGRASLKGAGHC